MEQDEESSSSCKPEKKGISDLDIREWNIELRENDLRMEEENVTKKEITFGRHCLEEKRSIKKAKDDLNIKEIELEKELRTLTEKKQDIKLNEPIILKLSFDFKENIEISYQIYEKTERDEKKSITDSSVNRISRTANKKTCLFANQGTNLNEDQKSGLGKKIIYQKCHFFNQQKCFQGLHLSTWVSLEGPVPGGEVGAPHTRVIAGAARGTAAQRTTPGSPVGVTPSLSPGGRLSVICR